MALKPMGSGFTRRQYVWVTSLWLFEWEARLGLAEAGALFLGYRPLTGHVVSLTPSYRV